jgi:nucleoside-diphosphate-sugar epimerase
MNKVLITGSAGFIGSHLTQFLAKNGYDVLGVDKRHSNAGPELYKSTICDILDLEKLCKIFYEYQPDIVIHLAARTDLEEQKNIEGYASNTKGTENVLRAINSVGCVKRALITSSQLVCRIGYIPENDSDYCPNNLYGKSKALAEQIVRNTELPGVTWSLLRPTTIWGEGMSEHYQSFIRMVKGGKYFHVGKNLLHKSYGYVGNTIYQYMRFIESPAEIIHGRTFYIADYQPLSLRKWVDSLAKELNANRVCSIPESLAWSVAYVGDFLNKVGFKRFPLNSFRLQNILTEYVFDLKSTENVCGPLPYSVEQGIYRTIRWFECK